MPKFDRKGRTNRDLEVFVLEVFSVNTETSSAVVVQEVTSLYHEVLDYPVEMTTLKSGGLETVK